MTVAERIKQTRKERGITQEELARRCGTIKQTISKYENGIVSLSLDMVETIANVLRVPPGYLMGWTDIEGNQLNAKISPKKQALLDLVDQASDEEVDKLLRLVDIVLEQRKQ